MTGSSFRRKDIISDLPRNIIESILGRMPVRDAARTSVLSSKWRCIWTTISQLVLDNQFFEETFRIKPIVKPELANVQKILLLHNDPIQKFVLCLPVLLFNGSSDIDRWILFLSRNGIKDFTLDHSANNPYEMHSCIYSCQELTQLKLINCVLKLPLELSGFRNVTELRLDKVKFGNNMLRTLLSRSGLLRELNITLCSGIGHLNIRALNLRILTIAGNSGIDSFSLVDNPEIWLCIIGLGKTMTSLTRGSTPSLAEFLVELPRVSHLILDSFFLEASNKIYLCDNALIFKDGVQRLDVLPSTLLLIRSCPNLTKLNIWIFPNYEHFRVVNYLEASACMDQSEQTFAALLCVRIKCLNGLKPYLLLIKLLLACSPKLETLAVKLSSQLDVSEGFKISKELLQFPRLSRKAAVIF